MTEREIMKRLKEHYKEALEHFNEDCIVGIFLQGSQNYNLDTKHSDVDTKLVVVPSFKDIVFNRKPISTTHIRENDEHIDFKDLRLMLQTFRKQNINFIEILFTPYKIINPKYKKAWGKLEKNAEMIAHYNRYTAVKAIKGSALQKFHALKHEYPSKVEVIKQYGYDPKQLHHLLRFEEFMVRYLADVSYRQCLISNQKNFLLDVKNGKYSLEEAERLANESIEHINDMCLKIDLDKEKYNWNNKTVDYLLDEVQYEIMEKAILGE